MSETVLEVKGLSLSFHTSSGRVEAVRNVSFSLKKGETLALVGESGCGKSAACRAVMRLLARNATIDSGAILLHGEDLLEKSRREMRGVRGAKIAMIFQDPMTSLDPTMKIGRQIAETIALHKKVSRGAARARALELLRLVGIDEPERRYGQYSHEFSGGQRQRIVIAIALAADPDVLIADEPTTALDVTMQAQIIDLLRDIQKRTGTSIIFITHDLGVVANVADRIAVMYAGDIVEIGQCEDIFYQPKHPYTWALLSSLPQLGVKGEPLYSIRGTPPNLFYEVKGDAFAPRNPHALKIDFEKRPPYFDVSPTHKARTWLLDPRAPKIDPPEAVQILAREGVKGYDR